MVDKIKVKLLHNLATFDRAHADDVGYDLTCCGIDTGGNLVRLLLGIKVQPPKGMYFNVFMRSSFPKTGWVLANATGIIDPGYRGEWIMQVYPYRGKRLPEVDLVGMKVAQAVLYDTKTPSVEVVDELTETERGVGGFGSTDL